MLLASVLWYYKNKFSFVVNILFGG